MAENSVMHNIGAVEQFGKNIANINAQQMQIFKKLQNQVKQIGTVWQDDMYNRFAEQFNQDIMKKVQEINVTLDMFAKYVQKQCEFHRMAQNNRW